jgi:predicted NACHT family NTPase
MATTIPQQFRSYLQSISDRYQDWWNYYTLTDVEGQKQLKQCFPSPFKFDFGLMVQTVVPQTADNREKPEEKIERLSVLEGINKYASGHVLLVGKPGSGKSTALIRLLLEKAKSYPATDLGSEVTIPILVELRYWKTSIFAQIKEFLQQHDTNLILDEITLTSLLNQGQFLFLIDGVNELPSEAARRDVAAFRHLDANCRGFSHSNRNRSAKFCHWV